MNQHHFSTPQINNLKFLLAFFFLEFFFADFGSIDFLNCFSITRTN